MYIIDIIGERYNFIFFQYKIQKRLVHSKLRNRPGVNKAAKLVFMNKKFLFDLLY